MLTFPAVRADEQEATKLATVAITNGKIWTGVVGGPQADPNQAAPTAIAVFRDKIIAVGSDAEIQGRIGDETKLIDARGRRVIPGITDSHTHMISGGFQLQRINLREVRSRQEFVDEVAQAARQRTEGQWVVGGRWSVESWEHPAPPRADWLDPVTGSTPVFLTRMDGHSALANSAALKMAGIDGDGPGDPVGGEIERDPVTRAPTGLLKDAAMGLVSRLIPDRSDDERYDALLRAMKHANALGITSVHDLSSLEDVQSFRRANKEESLTVRLTSYLSTESWHLYLEEVVGHRFGLNNSMIKVAGLKGFMDGSMGSRTAFMREPFADATPDMLNPRGLLTSFASSDSFERNISKADLRNAQMAVHAIGDEGIHRLLNAYEKAMKENGRSDARHRVEHAQHILPEDISRFGKLGVVASMQPYHKADDGRYAEKAIGKSRLAGSYAFRQLVDAKAVVIFGSDWPVVTMNPFAGMDAAVNARTLFGEVWLLDHSLTVEEALRAYTVWPAFAVHREDQLGTLEVGKLADMVILADDLLTIPKDRIGDVKVSVTIVGGQVVFDSAGSR